MRTLRRPALAMLVLVMLSPTVAVGQAAKAGIVTTMEGNVTARRALLPQPVALKFKDDVFFQDTITTGDRALARMLLGGKSMLTVRERSVVKITELPGRSTINLESGKVGVAVARDRMVPGESVEIRTPSAVLGIRGTVIVAEVLRTTAQDGEAVAGVTTNFFMLRGSGEVRRLDAATGAPVGPPVMLTAMQQVSVTGTTVRVAPIPPGHLAQINAGLESKGHPHVEAANQDQVKGQVTRATTAVLSVLTGGPGGLAATGVVSAATAAAVAANPNPTPVIAPSVPQAQTCATTPCGGTTASQAATIVAAASVVPPSVVESPVAAPPVVAAPVVTLPVVEVRVVTPPVMAPPVVTIPFPERLIVDDIRDLADGDRVLAAGGTFARSQTSSPVQVLRSTLDYVGTETNSLVQVDGPGTIVNLAGRLVTIAASAISPNGLLFVLSNGARLTSTVGSTTESALIRIESGAATSSSVIGSVLNQVTRTFDSPVFPTTDGVLQVTGDGASVSWMLKGAALIEIDSSTITNARAIASVLNQATLTLDGSFVAITDSVLKTTSERVTAFTVLNGASLIATSADPVFAFLGTAPGRNQVTTARGLFALGIDTDVGPAIPASMTLAGGLLAAVNTDFTVGDHTKSAVSAFFVGDGSTLTSTSPGPLLFFKGSSVDTAGNVLTLRRSLPGVPSQINLAGPLFFSDGSTFSTASLGLGAQFGIPAVACCDGFFISEGARLTSSTTSPLLHLINGSNFNAGPGDESGGSFVSVSDRSVDSSVITAAASVALNGPLLFMDSSSLTALVSLLRVVRSTFTSTGSATDALILAVRSTISVGSLLDLRSSDVPGTAATAASVSIAGPFLSATGADIASTDVLLRVRNGARFESFATNPLIDLIGTQVNLGSESLAGSGRVLNVFGTGGPDGTTPAQVVLNGALLVASGESTINALEGLVFASDGQLVASGTDPLVTLIGGTHVLASNFGASMFRLGGIPTAPAADEIVDGVPLTLGTFAPIVTAGSLLRLEDGASVSGQKAFFIDTALFEATAPVFDLAGGSNLTVAPTAEVDGGLMDLNARAKVVSAGPVVRLDASAITVLNNNAFRVAGGSLLKVVGDFLSLNNNSILDARNGAILSISGGSVVNIGGAFAAFGPVGFSLIKVNNTFCGEVACRTYGGIPIALTGGAQATQISVTGSAVKGVGSGAIFQSGSSAAAIVVDGTKAKLTIKGQ